MTVMKKYGLLICLMFMGMMVQADKYVIEELNGDYIMYNGVKLVKGSTFTNKDSICWDNSTAIHVRNTRTGNKERIREIDVKLQKEFSLWKYFVKINHGSSRTCEDYCLCSVLDDVFYLEDTIRVHTDDPKIIDVYTGYLPKSVLPDYYLTYNYNGYTYTATLPLEEDELIITKQNFMGIPETQRLLVSIYSVDQEGHKIMVTNSMTIEIQKTSDCNNKIFGIIDEYQNQ